MPAKPFLYLVVAVTVAVFALQAAIKGEPPSDAAGWLAPIGPSVGLAGLLALIFDRYVWRWRVVRKVQGTPLLDGTWHGELESAFVRPSGERVPIDPDVFLVVRQRYSSISARLYTKESQSRSIGAVLEKSTDGVYRLYHLYENTPRQTLQGRSPMHQGAATLSAPINGRQALEGHYFTGRSTHGELRFTRRYDEHVESHTAGRELVDSLPNPPSEG